VPGFGGRRGKCVVLPLYAARRENFRLRATHRNRQTGHIVLGILPARRVGVAALKPKFLPTRRRRRQRKA